MSSFRKFLGACAATTLLCAIAAGAPGAQAAATSGAATQTVHTATSSDYVVGWINTNRGGPRCNFTDSRNWDWVCSGFSNETSSLWNSSRTRAMNFFYLSDYQGAYVCLPPTASFNDLTQIHFNKGSNLAGYGAVANDNIVSSSWAAGSTC